MLREWRIRKKGSTADPYHDYGAFSNVFCLKINHGGAFTTPHKIRYKGGKEPNTTLDNGLKKLCNDQDVLQMLKYVDKYKVIDLYVDHSVTKEPGWPMWSVGFNGNRENDEDVNEDVSEDEWLQNSLRLVGRRKKDAIENNNVVESSINKRVVTNELRQSHRNESTNVESDRDHGSGSQNGSDRDHGSCSDVGSHNDDDLDSQESDLLVDPHKMVDDVEVDMAKFRRNIDANVEWVGSKEIEDVVEEGFEDEEVNHEGFDNMSDSKYESEWKKSLKMFNKRNKANAESSGTTWKENFVI
nr:transposase, MuDR [Tanacetum cinerariifolium]